ncbi:Hypothetical predicted protein [Paramuricea clavata]|uniref:Uncharacterized protein n=1 Tax=Paramuricea clavata TaxID=317549 RepID=A0A6S7KWT0_PARCT|nr:Hypothetical predicted protein [Paramuricea clavata]
MRRSKTVVKASHPQPLSEGGEKVDRSIRGREETTTCQPRIRDRGGIGDGVDGSVAVSDRDQAGGSIGTDVNLAGAVAGFTPSSWTMEVEEEPKTKAKVNISRLQPLSEEEMAGNSGNSGINSGNTLGSNPKAPTVDEEEDGELRNQPGAGNVRGPRQGTSQGSKQPFVASSGSRERDCDCDRDRDRDRGLNRHQDEQGHQASRRMDRDKCGERREEHRGDQRNRDRGKGHVRDRDRDRELKPWSKENPKFSFQDGKLLGRTELAASGAVPPPASGSVPSTSTTSVPSTSNLVRASTRSPSPKWKVKGIGKGSSSVAPSGSRERDRNRGLNRRQDEQGHDGGGGVGVGLVAGTGTGCVDVFDVTVVNFMSSINTIALSQGEGQWQELIHFRIGSTDRADRVKRGDRQEEHRGDQRNRIRDRDRESRLKENLRFSFQDGKADPLQDRQHLQKRLFLQHLDVMIGNLVCPAFYMNELALQATVFFSLNL